VPVEVPEVIVAEFITQVPRIDQQFVEKSVPAVRLEARERIVEVPVSLTEERLVEVPQIQTVEVLRQVPREQYQDIPRQIPQVEIQVRERVVPVSKQLIEEVPVEVPQLLTAEIVKEVPQAYNVNQKIQEEIVMAGEYAQPIRSGGVASRETLGLVGGYGGYGGSLGTSLIAPATTGYVGVPPSGLYPSTGSIGTYPLGSVGRVPNSVVF
jgi:hypothetical protein